MLIQSLENEARLEAFSKIKRIEEEANETAERKAREIISASIAKCASEYVVEATVSVVDLPNDEMKGRIIGREGRNIRALEKATGIDIIVDDTPEAIILSGFDSVRREIAKLALERLIADGRIHPARIEEVVEKVKKEVDTTIREAGEQACFEVRVPNLHAELVKTGGPPPLSHQLRPELPATFQRGGPSGRGDRLRTGDRFPPGQTGGPAA